MWTWRFNSVSVDSVRLPLPAGLLSSSSEQQTAALQRKGLGIYTHNYHSLLCSFKRLSVRVCVCAHTCVWETYNSMCICLCVVSGTTSPSVVSASLTPSVIHILVWARRLFVLTIQHGNTNIQWTSNSLFVFFSLIHNSSAVMNYHLQALWSVSLIYH